MPTAARKLQQLQLYKREAQRLPLPPLPKPARNLLLPLPLPLAALRLILIHGAMGKPHLLQPVFQRELAP